jgi:hypothetical protein
MEAIESLRVGHRQPRDESLDVINGLGPKHEMPVIRHDAESEKASRPDRLRLCHQLDEPTIRGSGGEERSTGLRPIGDVVDEAGDDGDSSTGHDAQRSRPVPISDSGVVTNHSGVVVESLRSR